MLGFYLFNKPSGPSSAQFLGQVKRILKIPKGIRIGHGGTLDPFASGLLIIGVGREYTRLLHQVLNGEIKEYEAQIIIGADSDTHDWTGNIITTNQLPITYNKEDFLKLITKAVEEIKNQKYQIPPQYSAVKINGKKAYELARQGEEVVIQPKETKLLSYEILSIQADDAGLIHLYVRLKVSAGYYIRSFARDLGKLLNSGAYVEKLERTAIGLWDIQDALRIGDFEEGGVMQYYLRAEGKVQGVGFRQFAKEAGDKISLHVFAENIDEHITICAKGNYENLAAYAKAVRIGPLLAQIEKRFEIFSR